MDEELELPAVLARGRDRCTALSIVMTDLLERFMVERVLSRLLADRQVKQQICSHDKDQDMSLAILQRSIFQRFCSHGGREL